MGTLTGKVAIVTGAASPIGFAITERLTSDGAAVMMADVMTEKVKELAEQVGKSSDNRVEWWATDLSSEDNFKALVQKTIDTFGQVDILVNNAGGGVILPFLEHTLETLQATLNRNLWTTIWGCRTVLPHMIQRKYGRIINLGADSVRNGLWQHAAYNAAKGGVHGLTTGLAREFAKDDITINTVAPCIVNVPSVETARKKDPKWVDDMINIVPKGRPGETSEIASMISYLASKEAAFVTGQVISVNGGSTML